MKISFEINDENAIWEVMDDIFIALLKMQKKQSKENLPNCWHEDDAKKNKAVIKACDVLLKYLTVDDCEL
jgi:uncharacterized protein YihD (DUF1040 family)